jgi:hypothetical protein
MVAIVDRVWDEYIAMKRTAEKFADPLDNFVRKYNHCTSHSHDVAAPQNELRITCPILTHCNDTEKMLSLIT